MNLLKKYSHIIKKTPANIIILFIKFYQKVFSPSQGVLRFLPFYPKNTCIFYPTCSEYSISCFEKYPFFSALKKSTRRISRCHPGNSPTVDLP